MSMLTDLKWNDLVAISTLATILSGLLYLILKSRLSNDFVTQAEYTGAQDELRKRLGEIETRLDRVPTHSDIQALARQIGEVGTQVAVVGEQARGLKDSVARIEHQLNMFLQATLERESH